MGKSDKGKKYAKLLGSQNVISNKNSSNNEVSNTNNITVTSKLNTLLMDLTSLEENKRLSACNVICNVFASFGNNSDTSVLQKYINKEIISALSLRIVDSSDKVRLSATFALRNITACGDMDINTFLITSGCVSTISEWLVSGLNSNNCITHVISMSLLLEQLLAILCNIRYLCIVYIKYCYFYVHNVYVVLPMVILQFYISTFNY